VCTQHVAATGLRRGDQLLSALSHGEASCLQAQQQCSDAVCKDKDTVSYALHVSAQQCWIIMYILQLALLTLQCHTACIVVNTATEATANDLTKAAMRKRTSTSTHRAAL
jgi:hypothetical protein